MPSLYKVIKNQSVEGNGKKLIDTEYEVKDLSSVTIDENPNSGAIIDSYENLAQSILEKARKQRDDIMSKAIEEAQSIEKEAYEKGYNLGAEQGYKDSYETHMEKALNEAKVLLDEAKEESSNMVLSAKALVEQYMEQKQEDILNLAYTIAQKILKEQVKREQGIDNMVIYALNEYKTSKSYVIRCNETHYNHLKSEINNFKDAIALKADIFIICDNTLEEGNAVIEKDDGKIEVGIDIGFERIKKELC